MKALHWVALFGVALAAACGGVSTIGSGTAPTEVAGSADASPGGTPGVAGGGVEAGGVSVGAGGPSGGQPSCAGSSVGTAGTGSSTTGVGNQPQMCEADSDCSQQSPLCQECADGSYACNKPFCNVGKCAHRNESCPAGCMSDRDCPVSALACMACADGSQSCPTTQCLKGRCETSFSGCNNVDPCKGLACGTECKQCENGKCADVPLYCGADRKCEPGIPQCGADVTCRTAGDCGAPPPNCVACGSASCATFECVAGACVFSCPPNPDPECKTTLDCPATGTCHRCPNGRCAAHVCWKGNCELGCEP